MGRSFDDEEACKGSNSEQEEEDEALSLSDLPLNLMIYEEKGLESREESTKLKENEEEFNFDSSWGGSLLAEQEMCVADEVFFKGQILPLRHSVSSDSGLARFQHEISCDTRRCLSRSESMDRGSSLMRGLTSIHSSRSSSTRSHYSSSSSKGSNTFTITPRNSKPRIRNQFHTFPSPKPQIRVSNARALANGGISRNQKSTVWDLFRLGLVRAPEIELQDLKFRNNINNCVSKNSVSRNSSSGSSSTNSSSGIKNYNGNCKINSSNVADAAKNQQDLNLGKKQQKRSFLDKRKGFFHGCKCSIAAVETVPLNDIVIIKSNITDESSSGSNSNSNNNESSSGTVQDMQKKLQELKIKQKMKEKQQAKQAMSRHRTFEWLRELSHASSLDGLEN